jgi:hypothetical protein
MSSFFPARPCQRCVKRGMADSCTEGHRKKAKYLLTDEELGTFTLSLPHACDSKLTPITEELRRNKPAKRLARAHASESTLSTSSLSASSANIPVPIAPAPAPIHASTSAPSVSLSTSRPTTTSQVQAPSHTLVLQATSNPDICTCLPSFPSIAWSWLCPRASGKERW